jgi:hypothetical protein
VEGHGAQGRARGSGAGAEPPGGCATGRKGARRGEERGGGGEEREGEGRGAHLGVQIRRSPSPKPRAPPRGERDGREREVAAREKSNERKRPGEGARRGVGALGACGQSWARLGRTVGQNPVAHTTTERNPIREAKSETKLSNTRD